MEHSSRGTAEQLTVLGEPTKPATVRLYDKLGLFPFRKTPRGEITVSDAEILQLAKLIASRRAARLAAFHRGRVAAQESRRAARVAQHEATHS
jgi:hypothetical protein